MKKEIIPVLLVLILFFSLALFQQITFTGQYSISNSLSQQQTPSNAAPLLRTNRQVAQPGVPFDESQQRTDFTELMNNCDALDDELEAREKKRMQQGGLLQGSGSIQPQQSGPLIELSTYFQNRFAGGSDHFSVGVSGDHHLWSLSVTDPRWNYEAEILTEFRRWTSQVQPLAFVVLDGDHGGGCGVGAAGTGCSQPNPINAQMQRYRTLMNQFSTLPIIVPQMGGHEKLDSPLVGPKQWADAFLPGVVQSVTGTGRDVYWYYAFDHGPSARFYILDANCYGSASCGSGGLLGEQIPQHELDWLADDLYNHKDRDAYLFIHEPIAYSNLNNQLPVSSLRCPTQPCNFVQVLEVLDQFPNVKAIFQAHKHIIYAPDQPYMRLQDKLFIAVYKDGDVLEVNGRTFRLARIQSTGTRNYIDLTNVRDFGSYPNPVGIKKYGFSTPSCQGSIAIGASSIPRTQSTTFSITSKKAPPNSSGWLIITGRPWDPGVPFSGVDIHVALDAQPLFFLVASDATGFSSTTIPIPLPSGAKVYAQYFWANTPSCSGSGPLSASNAMEITVQA